MVAADPGALQRAWSGASVVLLGAELAATARLLPPRDRVVVVGGAGDALWELAVDVGADHVAVLPSAGPMAGRPACLGRCRAHLPLTGAVRHRWPGRSRRDHARRGFGRSAAAAGTDVLLVDADPFGGGLDLALGLESATGDRWSQLVTPQSAGVSNGFLDRLPTRGGLRLLATDRDRPVAIGRTAMLGVLTAGQQRCGLTVIDLPRQLDSGIQAALETATCLYVVVSAQVRAVAAAAALISAVREHTAQIHAIVRGPAPSGLSLDTIARALTVPLAGAVRAEPGLARDYERGVPPGQPRGPLAKLCTELLLRLETERVGAAA